jgi:UDP-GlcNAc:undecaprenyl-phosphate GlcNAc-1-phosphate transferase
MSAQPWVLAIAVLVAFVLAAAAMPWAIRGWKALGRSDREISLRKVHHGEIARVGGFVMMATITAVAFRGLAGTGELSASHEWLSANPLTAALLGALLCGLIGLYDDLVGARARVKLAVQVAAAAIAVFGVGLRWHALAELLGPLAAAEPFVTALFLVAAVNAINLSDGLDGLAGGNTAIGFGVVLAATLVQPQPDLALGWVTAAALGGVLGFLAHNRHPARVFMGDAGSYFLGFLLPALLLQVSPVRERVAIIDVSIPVLVLALPLLDMGLSIARRAARGQPISAPDSDHVHHRLLARGFTHGRAVAVLWLTTALFSGLALLNVLGVGGWWTLTGAGVGLLLVAGLLGYHELLRRLPAFTGDRLVGLRDRRREVLELLADLDRLAEATRLKGQELAGAADPQLARWQEMAPALAPILARIGVPGFELRRGDTALIKVGDEARAWAFLGLPLPGGAELRLALVARLPELQAEQLMLIERVAGLLADRAPAAR